MSILSTNKRNLSLSFLKEKYAQKSYECLKKEDRRSASLVVSKYAFALIIKNSLQLTID